MIKQWIMAAFLLIHNILETIQYTQTIFNFTMLAQYVLYDNKIIWYIEYVLYRPEKTKIAFEKHWPINPKLCQPPLNYPKFYAISHFIQCIWDYSHAVNYNTAYNKAMYKYFLKVFYNRINKKEYDLQIW